MNQTSAQKQTEGTRDDAASTTGVKAIDMKLEVIVIPVSDAERAEQFQSWIRSEGNRALHNQPLLVVHDDFQALELVAIHGPHPAQKSGALIDLKLGCVRAGTTRSRSTERKSPRRLHAPRSAVPGSGC